MADITATINPQTSAGPQKVSVTLPAAAAAQNSSLSLKLLGDVDTQFNKNRQAKKLL